MMTTFATLFSGGELAGVGIRAAGLVHKWGIELDDAIAGVARLNGFNVLTADILDIDPAGLEPVDALHASPQSGLDSITEIWYNCNCLGEWSTGRFVFQNAVIQHNTFIVGKAPSVCGLTSRRSPRQRRQTRGGRFVMPKASKVKHSLNNGIKGKECLSCLNWLPLDQYNTDNSKKDHLNIYCKSCRAAKRAAKAGELNAQRRQAYAESPGETRQRNKTWLEKNKDKVNQLRRERRSAAPEKYRRQAREFYAKNRDKIVEETRQKRANNPYKHRQCSLRWTKQNPDKRKVQSQKRRAFINNANGSYTEQEWQQLKDYYNHTCLRCHRAEPEIKLTVDHVVPLSLGGSNSIDNLQPLCFQCNSGKKDKIIDYRPQYYGGNNE